MNSTPYSIKKEKDLIFSFISIGPKGRIEKLIKYETISDEFYNLGFGDRKGNSWLIDDKVMSDNGDIKKVIRTVIHTIPIFFSKYPFYGLLFSGSNKKRTRTYALIIERYLDEFTKEYNIFGGKEDIIEEFRKRQKYDFFMILKK